MNRKKKENFRSILLMNMEEKFQIKYKTIEPTLNKIYQP